MFKINGILNQWETVVKHQGNLGSRIFSELDIFAEGSAASSGGVRWSVAFLIFVFRGGSIIQRASVSPVGTLQGILQQYRDLCVQYSVGMWPCCSVCAWWQLSLCPDCPCALLAGPLTARTAGPRKEDWPSKRGCFGGNHLQKGLSLGSGGRHPRMGETERSYDPVVINLVEIFMQHSWTAQSCK